MIRADETFEGTYPFKPHFSTTSGFAQHYIDEGSGAPVVLLHGEPTWSYLYREIIPRLSERHRVIAPDYMGFGKSETPPDREYTPTGHADALERLLLALDLRDITLVLHDWGGMTGGQFALRHPDRVARLVVMNSALGLGLPVEAERLGHTLGTTPYFHWMRRLHETGTMPTALGEFGTIILAVMKGLQGFERPVDDVWLRAYGEPFATPEEAVGAIAFPRSAITGETGPLPPPLPEAVAALRAKPAMMVCGMRDKVLLPEDLIAIFTTQFPGAPVHRLERAGHFLQEDEPEAIALLVDQFIRFTPKQQQPRCSQ